MPDTVKTLAALQTLLADNTAGDISAQDVRDFLVSSRAWAYGYEAGADDVEWDAAANAVGDGTTLAISGSETITERFNWLDVVFSGQSANDLGGILYAKTIATGDKWAAPVQLMGYNADYTWAGVIMTDGVLASSNVMAAVTYLSSGGRRWIGAWSGTLTNFATGDQEVENPAANYLGSPLFLELEYVSANTFQVRFGPGYKSTMDFGWNNTSKTMTPTHVGVFWSKDGTLNEGAASFGSLRKTA